jgi:peptide deformylase
MAIREVLQFGNPALRARCSPIEARGPDPWILTDLRDTLKHLQRTEGLGRGLAAPQISYQARAIYINTPAREEFILNPEIVKRSQETFEVMDGCFSADLSFFGPVLRHRWVEVRYRDSSMEVRQELFHDEMSELIQHEVDHLDGILFIDRLADPSRIMTRREWERQRRNTGSHDIG